RNGSRAAEVAEPLLELLVWGHQMLHRGPRRQSDAREVPEDGEVAERIYSEAPGKSELGEHDRGDGRADDAREIESAGIQRDGVDEIFARHQLDDQRLPRGDLKRRDNSTKR